MEISSIEDDESEKNRKLMSRISFWISIIVSTAIVVWYVATHPPDSKEVQKMRIFFKENSRDVSVFIALPRDEMKEYAEQKRHPFYKSFLEKSEADRDKIRAMIHVSIDYTPYQYWFNMVFLWIIAFTTLWFFGLMTEGALVIMKKERTERIRKFNEKSETTNPQTDDKSESNS
ncbi:MAG: hypothetical protein COV66_11195 [Nitrospinae bacterium CG11_big_fil_rev_8_21_14_0_20_45_15]|nr:MAG: hypothetical protein COV66_11195 [Nitrospinae bacterium CG11_big_fil_rev_8_21_14_0_20_45_15]